MWKEFSPKYTVAERETRENERVQKRQKEQEKRNVMDGVDGSVCSRLLCSYESVYGSACQSGRTPRDDQFLYDRGK